MFLSIRTTTQPVSDLGYLLHKHPGKRQTFDLSFGRAEVFYPEVSDEAFTVALLVSVDTVALTRSRHGPRGESGSLRQYVNDRPYAASSFLSVAMAEVFGSALAGRCKDRPDEVPRPREFEVFLPAVVCRRGEEMIRSLFEPLGYHVELMRLELDPQFPEWGESRYYSLRLRGMHALQQLLSHLYVLIPVLDSEKHYWIGDDEVRKLLSRGEGWLDSHPARELIAARYLGHKRSLVDMAIEQLMPEAAEEDAAEEEELEKPVSLHDQRLGSAVAVLKASGARRVLDLGCGEGRLIKLLLAERQFEEILGMDVSHRCLEIAARRLRMERLPDTVKNRVRLLQGSLMYRDERLQGFDGAALLEVIEHLDPARLRNLERCVFEFAQPRMVAVTTPNREYNALWPSLLAGEFRHTDHRFEWSRGEFAAWAESVASRFGYRVRFLAVGPEDSNVGAPTQMAIFEK